MVYYNFLLTKLAKEQLQEDYDYIYYKFKNPLAADSFLRDANRTAESLVYMAGALSYCNNEKLAVQGYKTIKFKKHRYKFLFHIEGDTAIIDAVYHSKQNLRDPYKQPLKGC